LELEGVWTPKLLALEKTGALGVSAASRGHLGKEMGEAAAAVVLYDVFDIAGEKYGLSF
jgi:hypothetical protein